MHGWMYVYMYGGPHLVSRRMEECRMDLVVFVFCIYYLSAMVMMVDEVLLMMTMAAGVEQGQCLLYLPTSLPT